jgi:hypothetical protein
MTDSDKNWELMYEALAAFKRRHGHCTVRTNSWDHATLGRWVAQQRHRKRIHALRPWQIDRLDELGFTWSAPDRAWNLMFRMLDDFKAKHGHCNVSTASKQYRNLATWVARQRHMKRINALQQWRVGRLDELGFTWSACDRSWDLMLRRLGDFKARHGHCNVPRQSAEYRSLGGWVATQRHLRKIGELRPDRVKRLRDIRFRWSIRRPASHKRRPGIRRCDKKARIV